MQVSTDGVRHSGAITRGWVTAIVLTLYFGLGAFFAPVPAAGQFVIFLVIAIGMRRRLRWVAYGGACYLSSLIVLYAFKVEPEILRQGLAITLGLLTVAAVLLFRAARAADDTRGSIVPWAVLCTGTLLFGAVFDAYVMPTGSMEKTLLLGDSILVRTTAVGTPARGEMIVFHYPVEPKQVFVKRIVAAAGDRVQLREKKLYVNGIAQSEPYAVHATEYIDDYRDNFPKLGAYGHNQTWSDYLEKNIVAGELAVPPGKYFVLGDNRDDSLDSRYWGFVDRAEIIGKPVMIYFSVAGPPLRLDESTTFPRPVLLDPARIRWSRIFKLL